MYIHTWKEFNPESWSVNDLPFGSMFWMKSLSAKTILSGRKQLIGNNFKKGVLSSSLHSKGNLSVSGVVWDAHSLNRGELSSTLEENFVKYSSSSESPTVLAHFVKLIN